jgi:hypothetical protein
MCMQCVAQSTPMVAVSFGLLRRKALAAQVKAGLQLALGDRPKAGPQRSSGSSGENISQLG